MTEKQKSLIALAILVGIIGVGFALARSNQAEVDDLCPTIIRDPAVIERFGPSATCRRARSSGPHQQAIQVHGPKGTGVVLCENGRISF